MGNQRIIALAISIIAALLVIMAGKSCADDINDTNKEGNGASTTSASVPDNNNNNNNNNNRATSSRRNDPPAVEEITETVPTELPALEYVTDEEGNTIGYIPIEEETEPTTAHSLIGDYQARKAEREAKKNEATTEEEYNVPSEVHITIN